MNDAYGHLVAPDTLRIQRSLPGPVERVWTFLTAPEERGLWLARGDMALHVGGKVELLFQHDTLSVEAGEPPARYAQMRDGARLQGRITVCDPPHRLGYTWGDPDQGASEVLFELAPLQDRVLLTVTHSRLGDRAAKVSVSSGWHTHLDILADRLEGRAPTNFWRSQAALEAEYEQRIPAAS